MESSLKIIIFSELQGSVQRDGRRAAVVQQEVHTLVDGSQHPGWGADSAASVWGVASTLALPAAFLLLLIFMMTRLAQPFQTWLQALPLTSLSTLTVCHR